MPDNKIGLMLRPMSTSGNDQSPVDDDANNNNNINNNDEDGDDAGAATASEAAWNQPYYSLMGSMLQKTTSRAIRTLSIRSTASDNDSSESSMEASTDNLLVEAFIRSDAIIVDRDIIVDDDEINVEREATGGKNIIEGECVASAPTTNQGGHEDKRTYLGNPSVTLTALAHSLWRSTILPYQDTVIDATCGNGKDCLALARMLFPDSFSGANDKVYDDMNHVGGDNLVDDATIPAPPKPHLIGIDIQPRAIANTKSSFLSSSLPLDIYYKHVTLLQQSHEHLLDVIPRKGEGEDARIASVGLVCYNLGFLPGAPSATQLDRNQHSNTMPGKKNTNYKKCQTQTRTTLNSITDASLMLRVGGLLSIMTYPGSNLEESIAVEHFVEGLAMLTTRDVGGWLGYAESIPDYGNEDGEDKGTVRTMVTQALERVTKMGTADQTWRAFAHRPLGRRLSPVLIAAMRIK